jgi:phosphoribosylaminoimidazole-succinocarboxamide synthase
MDAVPEKLEQFYEGKAKKLYATSDPDLVIAYFKDDATAFNAKKRGTIEDKGIVNNRLSELFFQLLERHGVPTHFVKRLRSSWWCATSWRARWRSGWGARRARSSSAR